jgi:hypothetical protein
MQETFTLTGVLNAAFLIEAGRPISISASTETENSTKD